MSDIVIKLPKETLLEIIRQLPPEELEDLTREVKSRVSLLSPQLEQARAATQPFSVQRSPFFSLPPSDLGPTSAGELDRIIAEEARRES